MIRRMRQDDVDGIVDIWFAASIQAHHFISREFWEQNRAAMRDIYIPHSETWVLDDEGKMIGFYSLAGDTLAAIFVHPECQGQGFGGRLLDHAKGQRNRLELCVYVENKPAQAFYRTRGFTPVQTQLDERTGQYEYLMEWKGNSESPSRQGTGA